MTAGPPACRRLADGRSAGPRKTQFGRASPDTYPTSPSPGEPPPVDRQHHAMHVVGGGGGEEDGGAADVVRVAPFAGRDAGEDVGVALRVLAQGFRVAGDEIARRD